MHQQYNVQQLTLVLFPHPSEATTDQRQLSEVNMQITKNYFSSKLLLIHVLSNKKALYLIHVHFRK